MSLQQAIELLKKEYDRAVKLEFVRDPLAYALFQTWKKADREGGNRKCSK